METKDANISREMLYEQVWEEPISKLALTMEFQGHTLHEFVVN